MPDHTIHLAFDFFKPSLYGNDGVDDYGDAEFLIIQPLLLEGSGPSLDAYLEQSGTPQYGQLKGANHVHSQPVPLPPGAKVTLTAEWQPGQTTLLGERTIGDGSGVYGLTQSEWVDFVRANFISLDVTAYSELSDPQQKEFSRWARSLVIDVRDRQNRKAAVCGAEAKLTELLDAWKAEDVKWDDAFTAQVASSMFDLLWVSKEPLATDPCIRPPKFVCAPNKLADCASRFKAGSYHTHLWDLMRETARKPAPQPDLPSGLKRATDALGRLFGFGERLRWRQAKEDRTHFMVLRDQADLPLDLTNPNHWFVTNVQSLLGHVFEVTPPDKDAQSVLTLTVDHSTFHLGEGFDAFRRDVDTKRTFSAVLRRDPAGALDQGRVAYLPRNARAQATALTWDNKKVGAAPAAVLDALDPFARLESRPGTWIGWQAMKIPLAVKQPLPAMNAEIIQSHTPRTLIRPADLYDNGSHLNTAPRLILLAGELKMRALADSPTDAKHAYELTITEEVHADDICDITAALKKKPVKLLIHGSEIELGTVSLRDRGDCVPPIIDFVASPDLFKDPQPTADHGLRVDLAVENADAFNAVAHGPDPAPLFILRNHFDHVYSLSTEQIFERTRLERTPALPPPNDDGSLQSLDSSARHFSNYNKLRMIASQKPDAPVDFTKVMREDPIDLVVLNFPDALLPLEPAKPENGDELLDRAPRVRPMEKGREPASNDWYRIGRSFTENFDRATGDKGAAAEARARVLAEAPRFAMYRDAGAAWHLRGIIEHQYGHRVHAGAEKAVPIFHSEEIRNLAGLAGFIQAAAKDQKEAPEKIRVPALTYSYENKVLSVRLNYEYFKILFAENNVTENPSQLRPLYEALIDLVKNDAELSIELWNFDNRAPRFETTSDAAFPSIVKHLVFLQSISRAATPLADRFRPLVASNFTAFFERIVAAAANQNDPIFQTVAFPLNELNDDETDIIRTGLVIRRHADRVLPPSVADSARYLPLATAAERPAGNDTALEAITNLNPGSMEPEAKNEFQRLLATEPDPQSRVMTALRESTAWLTSVDNNRGQEKGGDVRDFKEPPSHRLEKLFGGAAQFITFPNTARPDVDEMMRIFYVPHAFVPLAQHSALGDAQTTREFAEFILTLLADIGAGRNPSNVALEPSPASEASKARTDALDYLEDVAGRIADTLTIVDDRDGMATWENDAELRVFRRVMSLVDRLDEAEPGRNFRREAVQRLIADDATIYARAKALGIGIFDPATFSPRLHSIELTKQIILGSRGKREVSLATTPDVDRFTFAQLHGSGDLRFFIDVLDDASYSDEFAIEPNTLFGEEQAADPKNRRRGGVQARTAEDVIEQRNYFISTGEEKDNGRRQLEATIRHYNPEWHELRRNETMRRPVYVLPSRKAPAMPVAVVPNDANANAARSPWHTRLSAFDGVPESKPVDVSPARFKQVINAVIPEEIHLPPGPTIPAIRAKRMTDTSLAVNGNPKGWHHIDTYLSIYYFIVEPNEEREITFDKFEIEVEMSQTAFPIQDPAKPERMVAVSPLQQWYAYEKAQEQHPETKPMKPANLSARAAVDEIRAWCLEPASRIEWTRGKELIRPNSAPRDDSSPNSRHFRLEWKEESWTLDATKEDGAVGSVVAADILQIDSEDINKASFVLRFAVLDDPWHYTRARVRINRNMRDVDSNGDPDVNPAFRLTAVSDWVAYGRHVMSISDLDVLPTRARELVATGVSYDDWLIASGEKDFGPVLRNFFTEKLDNAGDETYWSATMLAGNYAVAGEVLQPLPIRHVEIASGSGGLAVYSPLDPNAPPARALNVRQFLTTRPVKELDAMTSNFDASLILTSSPYLRVRWLTANAQAGEPLFELTLPIVWEKTKLT